MRSVLTALLISLLFIACKKDDTPDEPIQPPAKDIVLVTTSAVPGEAVIAQANFTISKDTAIIIVGGKATVAFKGDSNQVLFIMPILPGNTSAVIDYRNIGLNKQLNIAVGNYSTIALPDAVINQFLVALDSTIEYYRQIENSPLIPLDPSHRLFLKYTRDRLAIKFASLTNEEKINAAYTIQHYMILPQESKMDSLNPNFYVRTAGSFDDVEEEFQNNTVNFLGKSILARRVIAAGTIIFIGGVGTANPFLAIAGAAMIIKGTQKIIDANGTSYSESINSVAKRTVGSDVYERIAADSVTLYNTVEKSVVFKGNFRTISQQDNSSDLLFAKLFEGRKSFEGAYNKLASIFSSFTSYLGGSAPTMPPGLKPMKASPVTKKVTIKASKLSLSGVSNPAITVTYVRGDSTLKIKASSTTVTQQTTFTFNVVYTNSATGSVVTDKINAVFKPMEPGSASLASGNNQTGQSGINLTNPLVVLVKDMNGQIMPGITVTWAVTSGGGQLGNVSTITNANGQASTTWKLGSTGTQTATATVKKSDGSQVTGSPVTFTGFLDCNPANPNPPVINGYTWGCTNGTTGNITINVSFSAPGPGMFPNGGSGGCNMASTCYPVRLYFKNTPTSTWEIAANGYYVTLISGTVNGSGTVNNGVVQIQWITPYCQPGKTPKQSLDMYYAGYQWKIQLINKCNERSAEVML